VTDFLLWLERSGLATWIREAPTVWAYPIVLTLHTIGLGIVVGVHAVVALRLLGFARHPPLGSLRPLFPIGWWAFALNAVTGVLLFIADASNKAFQTIFLIKLGLIVLALVGMVRIKRIVYQAPDGPERARGVAIASMLLWIGAIVAGRLMAYL
jgi:hypothetical protein